MVAQVAEEIHYPDGRVGLASTDEITGSGYANGDLTPVPIERRTWTTHFASLWIGCRSASRLHARRRPDPRRGGLGAGDRHGGLANLIVLVRMMLIAHAGTGFGVPFPVFARASFGLPAPTSRPCCGPGGLRLVRHPDLDRRRGVLRDRRGGRERLDARHAGHRRVPVDAVACRSRSSGCSRWRSSCAAWTRCAGSRTGPPRSC